MSEHGRFRDKENPEMMHEQQQPKEYIITDEQLLIVEHGCIYPDKDGCIGNRCKYHDPNPSFRDNVVCLLNEHDIANGVRSRPHPAPAHTASFPCDIPCNVPESCSLVKEAARKAREEYANAILIMGTTEDCPYGSCRRIKDTVHDPWGCVKCIAESLRTTTPQSPKNSSEFEEEDAKHPTEQEQPR